MFRQTGRGWVIEGLPHSSGGVFISDEEMNRFLEDRINELADRRLKYMVEHQRHTLVEEC